MEGENSPWILENPTRTSKIGSQSASTATSMNTWQRNADQRRKNVKQENISNVTREGI